MLMLIVGGSLVAGSDNPHDGIDAAGGPSTPSVGLNATRVPWENRNDDSPPRGYRRMPNFRPTDRLTGFLMPPSVDEWLPEKHLARFVVEVVDGLDLSAMSKCPSGRFASHMSR